MKTSLTIALTALILLLAGAHAGLFAQQTTVAESGEKKITIVKRSTDADGSEVTETIVKKGKSAESFDVEKYVRENRSDKVQVEVRIEDTKISKEQGADDWNDHDFGQHWNSCNDGKGAFLGVEQDSDEDEDQQGLVIDIVRGSAAAKAGLKNNDLVLRLNDQKMDRWSDLTAFMSTAKAGDKVRIAYRRNGQEAVAEATLTTQKEVSYQDKMQHGFLGVSEQDDDEDQAGVTVSVTEKSAAEKAGLQNGDIIVKLNDLAVSDFEDISDFMEDTQAGDKIQITYQRNGKSNTVEAILGEQKSWDWESWGQNWSEEWKKNWKGADFEVRQKEACLGVYTDGIGEGEQAAARIEDFTPESAAREVKLAQGDLITAVNGVRVKGHSDLWNEIAKYKAGDKVKVEYLREKTPLTVEATLKACRDNSSQVVISETDEAGDNSRRQFFTWKWDAGAEKQMRERRVITIHRGEGDAPKVNAAPNAQAPMADRNLKLQSFRAFPNPTQAQVTVEFRGEAVPTIVTLFDMAGRQLFREEMNAFAGDYSQQFDLTEYAKGTLLIQVQQGEQLYVEQIVVN